MIKKVNYFLGKFYESSLVLNNIVTKGVRIAIRLLPPKEMLLDRERHPVRKDYVIHHVLAENLIFSDGVKKK